MYHSVQHFTVILPASHQNGSKETSSGDETELLHRGGSWGQVMWTSGIYSIWLVWEGYIINYKNKCTAQKIHIVYYKYNKMWLWNIYKTIYLMMCMYLYFLKKGKFKFSIIMWGNKIQQSYNHIEEKWMSNVSGNDYLIYYCFPLQL